MRSVFWTIVVMLLLLLIGFLIFFIYKSFRRDGYKSKEILGKVVALKSLRTNGVLVRPGRIPTAQSDFSYSMWLFVDALTPSNQHHLLAYRTASSSGTPQDANFLVIADKATSRLIIKVKTRGVYSMPGSITNTRGYLAALTTGDDHGFMTLEIPYVPLQRWVHLTVVSDGNVLTLYKDSDVYEVKLYNMNGTQPVNHFPATPGGSFIVGTPEDSDTAATKIPDLIGFNGYMASVYFHNYALSQSRVRVIYRRGPRNTGWLTNGFFGYRLRNPIYLPERQLMFANDE
jgi:hypothetical protein